MFGDIACDGTLRVKICGITTAADAQAAIESGADALGINGFRRSKRYVDMFAAAGWLAEVASGVRNIAVLVDPSWEEAVAIASLPGIAALQLHGRETPEFCTKLASAGILFGKAIPATDATGLATAPLFSTRTIVLDSTKGAQFGGTGTTFPWGIARDLAAAHPTLRILVAGGLTPENVGEAVRIARPFGVDVTGGVESSPGRKDYGRMRAFIEAAKSAAA